MAGSIDQFMTVLTVVGLPCFAWSICAIWKPARPGAWPTLPLAARVVAPVAVLLTIGVPFVGVPVLGLAAWLLPRRWSEPRSLADRVGWTIFAAGIALMLTMTLFAGGQEVDGSWRPFATIRLHSRILLGFAALALAGPLGAYVLGLRRANRSALDEPLA